MSFFFNRTSKFSCLFCSVSDYPAYNYVESQKLAHFPSTFKHFTELLLIPYIRAFNPFLILDVFMVTQITFKI